MAHSQAKKEILEKLSDIFDSLDEQELHGVTFKDIIDFLYRNRKTYPCEDITTLVLLENYIVNLKTEIDA